MNKPKSCINKVPAIIPLPGNQHIYLQTGDLIGSGSFGDVFKCVHGRNNNRLLAVKFEKHSSKYPQLRHEYKIYEKLKGGSGIPGVHHFGSIGEYHYMIMDLLGPSLESLFNYCGRRFTTCTTFMLAEQILSLIEYLHDKKFVHRDIKPENLVLGPGNTVDKLFLIDFGLSKRYVTAAGAHVPLQTDTAFIGTVRYASINSQRHVTQSRRDDLESIGYMLIYFLNGSLPWQNHRCVAETNKQRKERILEMKVSTPISQLCTNLPQELEFYMKYCRERLFEEKPNYTYLRWMCRKVVQKLIGENNNHEYDWVVRNRKERQRMNH